MRLSFGKIFGIRVDIHWTFALLIIWIVYRNLSEGLDAVHIGWSVAFILSLFVCVTLHEFGHALTARRYGIQTKDITLYPIGGVARLEKMPEKPIQELWVALAGPAVNVVIMLMLSPFILSADFLQKETGEAFVIDGSNFLPMLGIINVWLALFNLIPAFPMDGGRVLRALLSLRLPRVTATQIAATIGKLLAVFFIIAGFYLNPFLIFIGLFIILGAHTEAEMVKAQSTISGLTLRDALMKNFQTIEKSAPISEAVKLLLNSEAKNFLVTDNNRPYGVIGRDHIIKGITTFGENAAIENIADTQLVVMNIDTPVNDVFVEFQKSHTPLILVREGEKLAGVIDLENITELIMINTARGKVE